MFRLDRFLTLYCFSPLRLSLKEKQGRKRVPILMYHDISDARDCRRHPYFETSTSRTVFSKQIAFLSRQGYQAVSLDRLMSSLKCCPSDVKQKLVAITFDDAFFSFYTEALPVLRRYNYEATVFAPSGLIGESLKEKELMSWDNLREVSGQGICIGSHTVSHPQLRNLKMNQIREELFASKHRINFELGMNTKSFSYPYAFPEHDGAFTKSIEALLEEAGYEVGVTTSVGLSSEKDHALFLRRIPVNAHDDEKLFSAKLNGGYDWLRLFQKFKKRIKFNASA
jgi:peptidoglycan/xylan/chitin deacetylase (PgdA/CDA1 family)